MTRLGERPGVTASSGSIVSTTIVSSHRARAGVFGRRDPDRTVYLETVVSSVSAPYASVVVPDIPVTIVDLQTPGIVFSRTEIREGAGMHFITLRLESEPTADVTVRTSSKMPKGRISTRTFDPSRTLTFEPAVSGRPNRWRSSSRTTEPITETCSSMCR